MRSRPVMMWTLAAIALAIVLATPATWRYHATCGWGFADGVQLGGGALLIGHGTVFVPAGFSIEKVDNATPLWDLWFRYDAYWGAWHVNVPTWALALLCAGPAAL